MINNPIRKTLFLAFLVALVLPASVYSVSNNKVRVRPYKWMNVETEHFIIHYDKEREAMVPFVADYLEKAWKEVGDTLDYQVKGKSDFFFYSNHNEFEQTNIVSVGEGTGGVAEAFKNRFLVFNNGSQTWLKHVIFHEFGHIAQFNVLYGGFWKSIRLLKSPFYPLWFMEGMAEYVSGDIDRAMGDMVVRDAVYYKKLPHLPELQGFGHLKPNQVTLAYKTGEAAMMFLADEYGPDKVGKILVTIKDYFDVSSALHNLLGTDLFRFDFRFHEYMNDKYHMFFQSAKPASEYGRALTSSDGLPQSNQGLALSPDGEKIYFISDRNGPSTIYEQNLKTNKVRSLLELKWNDFENIHARGRALSISRDGQTLAFAGEKIQSDYLYLFDLVSADLTQVKVPFQQIRTPVFSPVSDELVCVGMNHGINNLYLIDRQGRQIKQLTDNFQDEANPVFTPDGQHIIFSGEVMDQEGDDPMGRDLFKVDLANAVVEKLTHLPGEELESAVKPDGSIVFVRDRNDDGDLGFNLYQLNPQSGAVQQLTNLIGGAFSPRVSQATQKLYFVGYDNGERHIYEWTTDQDQLELASTIRRHPDLTMALERGGDLSQSTLLMETAKPYRFRGSTDLFVPFFFYSTLDGLVFADIWQFSDLLGNHQVQQQMQYASKNDFIDLAMFYTYARFRPRFTVGFRNTKFFNDIDQQHQEREFEGIGLVTYPLDRVRSLILGVGGTDRKETFLDQAQANIRAQDRFYLAGYSHDTVTGRYLVPTKGRRFSLTFQQGLEEFGGRDQYKTGSAQFVQYVPLPRESTLVGRVLYGRSVGPNAQVFRLGGIDRVRGLSRGSIVNKKQNAVVSSLESRVRLKYLNWRTRFLFPDFFFKAAYLVMFTDNAYGWDNRQERRDFKGERILNSVGTGISWPTFILQTFQLNLTVTWSKQTNDGSEIWYVSVGPRF